MLLKAALPTKSLLCRLRSYQFKVFRTNSSKTHFERRKLNFTPNHVYNVVADVGSYEKFVPWCKRSTVLTRNNKGFEAELTIGFGPFEEKYISNVEITETTVKAISTQTSLLEFLRSEWTITPSHDKNSCWVTFKIEFKFKSAVYSHISDVFFKDIVNSMVRAFETRCKTVKPSGT